MTILIAGLLLTLAAVATGPGWCLMLTPDIYVPPPDEPGLDRLDHAVAALAVKKKTRDTVRAGRLDKAPRDVLLDQAVEAGIINGEERLQVLDADEVRDEVIQAIRSIPRASALYAAEDRPEEREGILRITVRLRS